MDYAKFSTGAAAGTLVFSAGLLEEQTVLQGLDRALLALSWVALSISVATGSLACARVPVMIAEGNHDLEDRWFCLPGQLHQVLLMIGVLLLGAAMIGALFSGA